MGTNQQKYVGAFVLTAVIVLGAWYYGYGLWKIESSPLTPLTTTTKTERVRSSVKLTATPLPPRPIEAKGTLYFSLRNTNGGLPLGIYSYSLDTKKWTKVLVSPSLNPSYFINFASALSSDNKSIAFARKEVVDKQNPTLNAGQIYVSDLSGNNVRQITQSDTIFKRDPAWSLDSTMIAFIGKNSSSVSVPAELLKENWRTHLNGLTGSAYDEALAKVPENWTVYLSDLDGKEYKIAAGFNPLFSPDGKKLLILQGDGLHMFDISNPGKPTDLGPVVTRARVSLGMKVSMSQDATLLAWTYAGVTTESSKTEVSRINSWGVFSLTPVMTIEKTKGYWSAFSPDNKYFALEQMFTDESGKAYPVVQVYDIGTGSSDQILTFKNYKKEYLWFSGWEY